jgi:arginyl-tRNA synthetase
MRIALRCSLRSPNKIQRFNLPRLCLWNLLPLRRQFQTKGETDSRYFGSVREELSKISHYAVNKAFPNFPLDPVFTKVQQCKLDDDYQLSTAFTIAKKMSANVNEIARRIVDCFPPSTMIQKLTVTNGFIGIVLNNKWLAEFIVSKNLSTIRVTRPPKKILVDFASPNMGKELHVGHLRSILIGDCLSRVFEHQGHEVIRVSHVGDFGTIMGQLLAEAERQQEPWFLTIRQNPHLPIDKIPQWPTLSRLYKLYVDGKSRMSDANFASNANRMLLELQHPNGDPVVKKSWQLICEVSRRGFAEIYSKLGVSVEERGESTYAPLIPTVINELQAKGLIYESQGAKICQTRSDTAPIIVQRSDGVYLYAATDFAALYYRIHHLKVDEIYYVTDFSQERHFNTIVEIAKRAEWFDPQRVIIKHVPFGLVLGPNGSKLSSRDGTPMTIRQLLLDGIEETKKAVHASKTIIRGLRIEQDYFSRKKYRQNFSQYVETNESEKRFEVPKREGTLSSSSAPSVSTNDESNNSNSNQLKLSLHVDTSVDIEPLACNAIKYFELSQTRQSNYVFSFQDMLSIKGNSAMYLIYAYVRMRAIRRMAQQLNIPLPSFENKIDELSSVTTAANVKEDDNNKHGEWNFTKEERDLIIKLIQFPDVVKAVEETQQPHILSLFLFQLTQLFHSFYESCKILGHSQQTQRLLLCLNTESVLSKGLSLLNVTLLEHI